MGTTEINTLLSIVGVTLRDRIRSTKIRERYQEKDVVRWVAKRRREWDMHVGRMGSQIVFISEHRTNKMFLH